MRMKPIRTGKGRVPRELRALGPEQFDDLDPRMKDPLEEEDARADEQAEEVLLKHLKEEAVKGTFVTEDDGNDGFDRSSRRTSTRYDHSGDYDEDFDKEHYM